MTETHPVVPSVVAPSEPHDPESRAMRVLQLAVAAMQLAAEALEAAASKARAEGHKESGLALYVAAEQIGLVCKVARAEGARLFTDRADRLRRQAEAQEAFDRAVERATRERGDEGGLPS